MRPFFNFGKPKYQAPQVAPVPEGKSERNNAVYINEDKRCLRIDIFDNGAAWDLEMALGTLEVAKGVVANTISTWHAKEAQRKSILIPRGNGHG